MNRRTFLALGGATAGAAMTSSSWSKPSRPHRLRAFEWDEATIPQLQAALKSGAQSAVSLAKKYLERIQQIDRHGPALNSVIEINPDALEIARALDKERRQHGPRGPLHGIPVLLKDNIDTADRMLTTAGSLALAGSRPSGDSFVAQQLRKAGAVILGKTNLSEWANFRSTRSTSGWSARGGLTKNPYVLDRNPSGSSSGSAVAVSANLCAAAVGTETDGSIISPSSVCGIVGLKPTVGLVSRSGIIPISHSQDTAGPMGRTVTDIAILLSALAGVDPRDRSTEPSEGHIHSDYTKFLDAEGLRGARIGVARRHFRPGTLAEKLLENAINAMKEHGATIVDPADLPTHGKFGSPEFEVMLYEFKAGLNEYLAARGPEAEVKSLQELIEYNEKNCDKEMPHFGQELLIQAEAKGPLTEKAYLEALEKCRRLAREEGIDAVLNEHELDALIAPSSGPAARTDLLYGDRGLGGSSSAAAVAGYPNITLPIGLVSGLPVGLSFFGRAYSEPALLKIAFALEQATRHRRPPQFLSSIG